MRPMRAASPEQWCAGPGDLPPGSIGGEALMDPIVVVGSGASGVHFALGALRKGHRVVMLDVGHVGAPPVSPGESLNGLKRSLDDPARYFLGPKFEALI